MLLLAITAISSQAVIAEPWFEDLETSIADLPWIYEALIMKVGDTSVTVIVKEAFLGDAFTGDTLNIDFWEMGSCMAFDLTEGEEKLLIPDSSGNLQILGFPGNGFYLLKGFYDFNAFLLEPGVLSREELENLCSDNSLNERIVEIDIWFAGVSQFLVAKATETEEGWYIESDFPPLNELDLSERQLRLGGMDNLLIEPSVYITIPVDNGNNLTLSGRVMSCSDNVYRCTVYPTAPVIRTIDVLSLYLLDGVHPEVPVLDVEIIGADPSDLGLPEDPFLTTDEYGNLMLSSENGLLPINSIYMRDSNRRPAIGFGGIGDNATSIILDFSGLHEGPSGHLATDIFDTLEKGVVEGEISINYSSDIARFKLHIRRH
ncbi:MAG: hypothetical protein KAQ97_08000 [Candidatus Fermentibacteraceae bacterium]|nr:hypothetical protein [Candidatus Fermentibacteraceae bacterium]